MTLLFNNNDQKIKSAYLSDLQDKVNGLLPVGPNTIRVVEEMSYQSISTDDEYTIICLVRFGGANKISPDRHTTLQPLTLTIMSEADSSEIARGVFTALFSTYSMSTTTLSTFPAVVNYYSPTTMRNNTINGQERMIMYMSGAIAWSEEELNGYSITFEDDTTLTLSALQFNYNTQPLTSQAFNDPIGSTVVTGSNTGLTIGFTAGTDDYSLGLVKTALKEDGGITEFKATIKVGNIGTQKTYVVSGITGTLNTTLRTIDLPVNIMPKMEV